MKPVSLSRGKSSETCLRGRGLWTSYEDGRIRVTDGTSGLKVKAQAMVQLVLHTNGESNASQIAKTRLMTPKDAGIFFQSLAEVAEIQAPQIWMALMFE
jgi:hypothetical protein